MVWKTIKKYLPIIGIGLFLYILIKLNLKEVFKQIAETNKFYLLIAVFLVSFYLFFQTLKWHILARKQGMKIPFLESFKINIISDFYGLVTPGKLGSVIRASYLKKYADVGKGLSNFVIDKVLDLGSLFFLAIILGFFVLREQLNSVMGVLVLFFVLLILISVIFYNKQRSRFFLRIIYRKFIPKKMKEKAKATFNAFYEGLPKKNALTEVFLWNLIAWIMNYVVVYFIALSLGIQIKFIYLLAIYPVATLVAQIPITISGLGTREATLIWLFGLFNVEAVKVFSMSFMGIFIMAILPSLFALFFILKKKNKIIKNEIHDIKES